MDWDAVIASLTNTAEEGLKAAKETDGYATATIAAAMVATALAQALSDGLAKARSVRGGIR